MHWVRRNELPLGRTPSLRLDCRGLAPQRGSFGTPANPATAAPAIKPATANTTTTPLPTNTPTRWHPNNRSRTYTLRERRGPAEVAPEDQPHPPGQLPDAARLLVLGSRSPSYTALDVSRHGRRIYHLRRDPDSALVAGARDARIRLSTWSGYWTVCACAGLRCQIRRSLRACRRLRAAPCGATGVSRWNQTSWHGLRSWYRQAAGTRSAGPPSSRTRSGRRRVVVGPAPAPNLRARGHGRAGPADRERTRAAAKRLFAAIPRVISATSKWPSAGNHSRTSATFPPLLIELQKPARERSTNGPKRPSCGTSAPARSRLNGKLS